MNLVFVIKRTGSSASAEKQRGSYRYYTALSWHIKRVYEIHISSRQLANFNEQWQSTVTAS